MNPYESKIKQQPDFVSDTPNKFDSSKNFLKDIPIPELPSPITPIRELELGKLKKGEEYALTRIKTELANFIAGNIGLNEATLITIVNPPANINADLALPCFQLAKLFNKSPQQITQEIADCCNTDKLLLIKQAEAIKGFVNFKLDSDGFSQNVLSEVEELGDIYGHQNRGEGKTVIIDSSSPNIAKFMSVGHLRSTVLGESLARIYRASGYRVIRDNHLGDWGTQFGMLGAAYQNWGHELSDEKDAVSNLYNLYVRIHSEIEKEKESGRGESVLEKEGKEWFKKLEEGDQEAKKFLEWATAESLKEFQKVYDLLDVSYEYMLGESFYVPMLPDVINKLQDLGIATPDEEGGISVDLEDKKLGKLIIQKLDGASLYSTRDLATLAARTAWFSPEKIIYVVGGEQKDYFKQVFEVMKQWAGNEAPDAEHVSFGMVTLPDGKISTRKGRVIFLEDVLTEAIKRTYERIEANSDNSMSEEEKRKVARIIGVGAVKLFDLGQGRERNIKFDWDKALDIDGQTAPYIQYSYARTKAILNKAKKENIQINTTKTKITTDTELYLVKEIAQFPIAIAKAVEENKPSVIAEAIFRIADLFNHFYKESRVLNAPDQQIRDTRLRITAATGQTLKNGLDLLGIGVPDRM